MRFWRSIRSTTECTPAPMLGRASRGSRLGLNVVRDPVARSTPGSGQLPGVATLPAKITEHSVAAIPCDGHRQYDRLHLPLEARAIDLGASMSSRGSPGRKKRAHIPHRERQVLPVYRMISTGPAVQRLSPGEDPIREIEPRRGGTSWR